MFLTPFIDFGEPVEKFLGLPPLTRPEDDEPPVQCQVSEVKEESGFVAAGIQRVRIIGVSDRIKIVSSLGPGTTIEGVGIAIVSGPLDQSKAYFELLIEEDNTRLAAGLVGRNPTTVLSENWQVLSRVPNSISTGILGGQFQKGDVIGVQIDISDFPPSVSVFRDNDKLVKTASVSVRGDVWPAIELSSGSVTVVFNRSELSHLTQQRISRGIEALMFSRSII